MAEIRNGQGDIEARLAAERAAREAEEADSLMQNIENEAKDNLDNWIGRYAFEEVYNEEGYAPMFMDYDIDIYKENNQYYADVVGNGTVYVVDSSAMGLYSYQDREGITYVQDEDEFEDFIDQVKEICGEGKLRCKQKLDKFLVSGSAFKEELYGVMTEAVECGVGIIITVHLAKLKGYDALSKWVKA